MSSKTHTKKKKPRQKNPRQNNPKKKKTRHNKSKKHSQAGHTLYSKPITLVFEHALTNDRVLKKSANVKKYSIKNCNRRYK